MRVDGCGKGGEKVGLLKSIFRIMSTLTHNFKVLVCLHTQVFLFKLNDYYGMP